MPRSITIELEDEFPTNLEARSALGYACMWGIESGRVVNVKLFGSSDGSLSCHYFDGFEKDSKLTFFMMGLPPTEPNTGYGFHS